MRIGLVGKDNHKGLGVLTAEYREHLPIYKTLIYDNGDALHRFKDALYTKDPDKEIDWLADCDVVIVLELPWDSGFKKLRERGVKTILKVNYEFLPESFRWEPDLYHCSSSVNYETVKSDRKILLPDPVDTDKIKFKKRTRANVFVHHAGTLGINGANGTHELLRAIRYVKSDVRFIIRAQRKVDEINDPRVTIDYSHHENYWEMWGEGDVFVSLQKFRATSLPIQEAMASGMPVLSTAIQPFNEFVTWKVKPSGFHETQMARIIDVADVEPKDIAEAIDVIAHKQIPVESHEARAFAESISWNSLRDSYMKMFESVI